MNKPGLLWKGVVAIERPDPMRPGEPTCKVMSARTQIGGLRAIYTKVPLALVAHKFRATDGDSCYVYAELSGAPNDAHIQFYERASQREFFTHPEQLAAQH